MKSQVKFLPFAVALVAVAAVCAQAQLRTPRPSQKASVMQTVGVTDITIIYSRPADKLPTIKTALGATATAGEATLDGAPGAGKDFPLEPNGHIWRAGANE